ncbi:MAG: PIN domain-containing protein [Bryobacteraceae bacterium]|nr:PIN domain-containing protein [Bryobacteraceae bacterium]
MPAKPLPVDLFVELVADSGVPVLFFDTAAILDIVRCAYRPDLRLDLLRSAAAACAASKAVPGRQLWLAATPTVLKELADNRCGVLEELDKAISRTLREIGRFAEVARVLSASKAAAPDWLNDELQTGIVELMNRLMTALTVYEGSASCVARAYDRVRHGLAPASRGKQEMKDCVIFEEFLEMAEGLTAMGFARPRVFITPNDRDFGKPPEGRVCDDLVRVGANYVSNLSWAAHLIGP